MSYNNNNNYIPPVGTGNTNYLGNSGWGQGHTPQQHTANHVDAIADKAKFALQMQDMVISGIDSIEKELIEMTTVPVPPNSAQVRALAHRLNGLQNQLLQVSNHIKQFMVDIDRATDEIQHNRQGW